MKPGKAALSAACWFAIVGWPLMVNRRSILPLQPGGGPPPPSGCMPTSGMPPELAAVELLALTALAAVESSVELLEVEVSPVEPVELVELVPGAVVMLVP